MSVAQGRRFRVVEWNVENLFDTVHDAGFEDREFLPDGAYGWTSGRFFSKLSIVARTLAALGGTTPADLIALCEVENDSVLTALTRRSLLARLGYEYVMTRSADPRGIDVALLYQPLAFRPYSSRSLRVPVNPRSGHPSRDVLFVSGETVAGDTLHVFVCHLPSRRGGRRASEPYRMQCAGVIRAAVDSLLQTDSCAKIIIAGDFNDEPHNACIKTTLGASVPPDSGAIGTLAAMYVLTAGLEAPGGVRGTYKYRGVWNRLDNILVSGALLRSREGLHTTAVGCAIQALPHLVEPDGGNGDVKLRRTFLGRYWHGGASDHLPLILDLCY